MDNTIAAAACFPEGTPVPAGEPPRVTAVTVRPVGGEEADTGAVMIEADANGVLSASLPIAEAGWHRISATVSPGDLNRS